MDRVVISAAVPVIRQEFGFSLATMAVSSRRSAGGTRCFRFPAMVGRPYWAAPRTHDHRYLVVDIHLGHRVRLEARVR